MKVLIVTYYWPPAGGPGVQRWLKFAKYLPDFGIEPIVYVPENPTYPIVDDKIENEVPQGITVIKQPIIEPYNLASFFSKKKTKVISSGMIPSEKRQSATDQMLLWIRGNLFIPDARVLWVKPSVKYLKEYINNNNIETVITTGPPHSLHQIGRKLKKNLGIEWIADFRDPWTTIGYHKALKLSSYAEKKHKRLEKKTLKKADKIIVTSNTTKKEFSLITKKPIKVITNGFDTQNPIAKNLGGKFSLAHIGSFLKDRNPIVLWEVLQELCENHPTFQKDFKLKLIGKVSDEIYDSISKYGLRRNMFKWGYVSHEEALYHQKNSQVLLLLEIDSQDTKAIIPGKLFEYMVSERPILAIGPQGSDIEPILKETNTGVFFDYREKDQLKQTILSYYDQFLSGGLEVNAIGLQKYSRKNLTKELSKFISKH